jgi:hypothetical protein
LIDYHPRLPLKNWSSPFFFYFVKNALSRKILYFTLEMSRALNDTPFVDKNKIVINSFFYGEIKIIK